MSTKVYILCLGCIVYTSQQTYYSLWLSAYSCRYFCMDQNAKQEDQDLQNSKWLFHSLPLLLSPTVPVWSGVNIAGVRLRDLNPLVGTSEDPEKYNEMHKEVVNRYCSVYFCSAHIFLSSTFLSPF